MKKVLLILAFIVSLPVFGQETYKTYCDLKGVDNVSAKKTSVEIILDGEKIEMNDLVRPNGEKVEISQMVEAMNFMNKLGWELESTYAVFGNGRTVYHWIISKEIRNENEIKEGIRTSK